MSATYWVEMKLNYDNEKNIVDAVAAFLRRNKWKCKVPASIDEAVLWLLHGNEKNSQFEKNGQGSYSAGFNAAYGWEQVMYDVFQALKPSLKKGSKLEVWPDSGHWKEAK